MRKLVIVLILLVEILSLSAQNVDITKAKEIAVKFYNNQINYKEKINNVDQITLSDLNLSKVDYVSTENDKTTSVPYYYIFNLNDKKGYVVVSANKNVKPILGYSLTGNFDINDMPPALQNWLSFLRMQINIIYKNDIKNSSFAQEWDQFEKNSKEVSNPNGPLLGDIQWAQGSPFNMQLYYNTGRYLLPMGCVAIATAQVMNYYKYPLKGSGSFSYTENGYDPQIGELTADFDNEYYDWQYYEGYYNNETYGSITYNLKQLIYDVAIAVETDFGFNASYSNIIKVGSSDANDALENFFLYDDIRFKGVDIATNKDNWESMIRNEIDNKRPIIYRASDENGENGHAFICDGYADDGYFHFNWGWRGYSDDWYILDLMNPYISENVQIDYSYGWINHQHEMLINIQPDYSSPLQDKYENDNTFDYSRKIDNNTKQLHSVSPTNDVDYYNFTLTATSDVIIETEGVNGNTQIWLYDDTRTFVTYDDDSGDSENAKVEIRLEKGMYYFMVDEKGNDENIPSYIISYSSISNEPQLSNPTVSPETGDENGDFKFSVYYSDADEDVPLSGEAKLYIYGNQDKTLQMTLESGDAYNGTYSCTTNLPVGSYSYRMSFTNNSNQNVVTDLQDGPNVHSSENMTIIPILSCGVDETSEIELRYKINDGSYIYTILDVGENTGFEVPPSGSVSLSLSTEGNYTFNEYELVQDGDVVWSYGHSGTTINFTDYASGIFQLNIDLDYTPQNFTVSGVVNNEDNTPYTGAINLSLTSSQQSLSTTSSAGSFNFSNVKGGVPIEISASGALIGEQINPELYSLKNLDEDETEFKFQISSNDQTAPTVQLTDKPDEQAINEEVTFSWIGTDDISEETNLLYQFKLEGYDLAFSEWSNIKTVSYSLPNGIYNFVINCKDEAGNASNTPLEYSFIVNANPQIAANAKFEKGVWSTSIALKNTGTKENVNQVVLLPEHSLGSIENIVPVKLYSVNDNSLIGGLDKIANTINVDTVFITQSKGFIFNIPDEFPDTDTLEYIIEWGVNSKFGWQETHTVPGGFPNVSDISPYNSDITEDRFLDSDGNLWRLAVSYKKILTDDKYITNSWTYIDKANSNEILINEKEIEYIQGSWESGVRYTRPECSTAKIFELDNKIVVTIREEKYERTYPGGDFLDSNYERYVVIFLDKNGNILKKVEGDWKQDVTYYLPEKSINNKIWFTYSYFGDLKRSLFFTILDGNGNIVNEETEYYSVDIYHDVDDEEILAINDNAILIFEDSWENVNNDDRKNLCYQIRNNNGDIVKGTTVINPSLLDESFDHRDEYELDEVLIDNFGRVWLTYDHDLGSEQYLYYIIFSESGNIIEGPTEIPRDIDFYTCDKDNYVWLQRGDSIYLYDSDLNKNQFNRTKVLIPNQNIGDKIAKVDYYSYNIFDRWSPNLLTFNSDENSLPEKMEIFNDGINEDVKIESLSVSLNDNSVYNSDTEMKDSISINLKDEFTIGNNLVSLDQSSLLGGDIIVTLPIVFNREPQLIIPFPDISLEEDFGDTTLVQVLNEVFSDDQELNYQLEFDQSIIQAQIINNKIEITSIDDQFGNLEFIVKANDGEYSISDTFMISINPINDSPVIADQTFDIEENIANETIIGTIVANDVDDDNITFTILSGNINNTFDVVSNTGEIYVLDSTELNYEAQTYIDLIIEVQDDGEGNLTDEANVRINISPINESPSIEDQTFYVDENVSNGYLIGTILAEDVDGDNIYLKIITGNINSTFSLDSVSGELTVIDSTELDYEKQEYINLIVQVQDDGQDVLSDEATVRVNINDVYENPNGINEFVFNGIVFRVFPNPANEYLEIEFNRKLKRNINIKILNGSGQYEHIDNINILDNKYRFNCEGLTPGIYLLQLESGDDIKTVKFIKQ